MVLVDSALGGPLKRALPTSPEHWLLFTVFFGTPHIVASSLLLFGIAEYRRYFATKILTWSAIILASLVLLDAVVSYEVMYALISGWTVKHVLGQQFGIGNSVARCQGRWFTCWQACSFAGGTLAFLVLYRGGHWSHAWYKTGKFGVVVLGLVVLGIGAKLAHEAAPGDARRWVWSNTALVVVSVLMLLVGYPFFTVLIPRLIHDTTAFMVYGTHERNRALARGRNTLRQLVIGGGAACAIAVLLEQVLDRPMISMANAFGAELSQPASLYVAGFISLLHYCSEAETWRSGSPYRAHFAMK